MLFDVDKTTRDVFVIFYRFLENLLESENLVCVATARTKTVCWVFFSFSKRLAYTLQEGHVEKRSVASAFHLAFVFVLVGDQASLPIFRWPYRSPPQWRKQVSQRFPYLFKGLSMFGWFYHNLRPPFITTCKPPTLPYFDRQDGMKVTRFKRYLNHCLHLPNMSSRFWVVNQFGLWWFWQYCLFFCEDTGWFARALCCLAGNYN